MLSFCTTVPSPSPDIPCHRSTLSFPSADFRAVVEALEIPVYLFNAGLPQPPVVPALIWAELQPGEFQGCALELATVKHIMERFG